MIVPHILEKIAQNMKCSLHIYDQNGKVKLSYYYEQISGDFFEDDRSLFEWFMKELDAKNNDVAVITENKTIIYGVFRDVEGCLYVFGPVAIEELGRSEINEYRKKYNISDHQYKIPVNTAFAMANILVIAIGVVEGKEISEDQILGLTPEKDFCKPTVKNWDVVKYNLYREEYGETRINYQEEQNILDYIRTGNVDIFKKGNEKTFELSKQIGKMAKSAHKQWEYMAVTSIILSSRAAIGGGLSSYIAYSISDLYLQQLEQCNGVVDIMKIIPMMQRDYAQRVKNIRDKKKSIYYIEQCKDIIAQNINQHITVEEIALKIGINRSYLSRKFVDQEGISISNYILNARLYAAENMLKESEDISIQMISEYFCFSSQSHFASLFKKKNGVTPLEYRQTNRVI